MLNAEPGTGIRPYHLKQFIQSSLYNFNPKIKANKIYFIVKLLKMRDLHLHVKFGLSYYDFDLLGQWLPEDEYVWERKEFAKAASARKKVKQNRGEELLIMNYEIEDYNLEKFFKDG